MAIASLLVVLNIMKLEITKEMRQTQKLIGSEFVP